MNKFVAGPARPIKCLRCKLPMELKDIAKGCFIGKCPHCGLEVRGSIGEYQRSDSASAADTGIKPYMTMITYPEDFAKDDLGPAARDNARGKYKPMALRRPPKLFGD